MLLLNALILHYKYVKSRNPAHVNDLLDFVQKQYIIGRLSIWEYKILFHELDKRGAKPAADCKS
ncbi:YppF family protein [Peribacillus deserti]|uniref:YppF-like protein n=1 Tax=Peribacillus deserti TaxID=673318 RepID=A0A2N5M830_9BACI|nr:YppF family protein [Peribacillus deserti]PLT30463.1 hypothetical protein CUU66_07315 [Peribacillus deserti]